MRPQVYSGADIRGNAMLFRRDLLAASAAALALAHLPRAWAQQQFSNLNVFIPASPGGGWDGLGRAIELVARPAGLVGTFQFENVGGAGGVVGLPRFVSQRRGRGDAIMVAGAVMVGAVLTNKSPVGMKDLVPLARMTDESPIIVVPASSPYKTIADLLAALKADPGKVPVGGGSAGGIDHITLGLMLKALGKSAKQASYVAFAGGGPAQAALLGAQVAAGISGYSEFSEQVKAGRLRALATASEKRVLPDVPTLRESGVDVVVGNWRGVFGPPGISATQKAALVKFLTDLNALPAWEKLLAERGWDNAFLAGPAFEEFIKKDTESTEVVLKEIGLIA